MALQGRDQFHPPGTVFMHDYVGFCAQPVWPALGQKNIYIYIFRHIYIYAQVYLSETRAYRGLISVDYCVLKNLFLQ